MIKKIRPFLITTTVDCYYDHMYECTMVLLPKLFLEIVTGFSFVRDEVIAFATVSVLFRSWTAGGGFSAVCTFDTSN